ncbi:PREDICTED: signal recognition particle subunit SRP72 [Papilio polytes]|uniref:signal recognition particle subunit SRP72 n=1 Tax=Papilio polytes TaxID=76194 RepID=UPI000676924E|nr:PREDICTED: signal recognition particle subunit SRP72 [Papilio polytes]
MSANKESSLVQGYIELNKFCQSGDYERALKSAGKILQISPTEQKAFHCKIICFIQLHNFKEALAVLNNPKNAALAADLHFEKAYTQYRLNCPKDALQTVDNAPELTLALKELRAQILYRLEQYQDCYNLYRDIVKNTTDDYEDERKANMSAVVANLAALNPNAELPQFEENTYELQYNAGSTLVMRGKFTEALPVLKRAEQTCMESVLEDGGTEDEAREEAAIIRVQQGYSLQCAGRDKEAAALYQAVLRARPADQALVAVASNNLVVINRDSNVFDSRKRMKAATADGLEHKLTSRQRAVIVYNQAILAIYSNQPEFCKQCCVKLSRELGQEARAALVEAASLARDGRRDAALALLARRPHHALPAAQILLAQGDRKAAIKVLEESEVRYRPGVVGALATLLAADGDHHRVSQMFLHVYNHYKDDLVSPALREGTIDIEALESSKWMMGAKVVKKTVQSKQEQSPGTPGSELGVTKKQKRKRKSKLPPNADLSKPPDPERWLPKYERAAYRKRRGVRRDVIKGSQGMTTAAVDQYDMSKQPVSASPAGAGGAGGAAGAGGAGGAAVKSPRPADSGWQRKQQHKKKGKGRK